MAGPFEERKKDYHQEYPGEALFWNFRGNPAIRLTVPALGLEFSDNQYIGRDPMGSFYFNNRSDIPIQKESNYEVKAERHGEDVYVNVRFYRTLSDEHPYAEFFAIDHANAVEESGINNKIGVATWRETDFGDGFGNLKKDANQSEVTLTVPSLHWQAKFNVEGQLKIESLNLSGRLRFKDEEMLEKGIFVRWDADHLVFYESDYSSRDWTAYFLFMDNEKQFMTTFQSLDVVYSDVKWEHTKKRWD